MSAPFLRVPVRLTEAELEHVARIAALKGMSVSDMLREAAGFAPEADVRARDLRPDPRHLHLVTL